MLATIIIFQENVLMGVKHRGKKSLRWKTYAEETLEGPGVPILTALNYNCVIIFPFSPTSV